MMENSLKWQIKLHTPVSTRPKYLSNSIPFTLTINAMTTSIYKTVTNASRLTQLYSWFQLKSEFEAEFPIEIPTWVHRLSNNHGCPPPHRKRFEQLVEFLGDILTCEYERFSFDHIIKKQVFHDPFWVLQSPCRLHGQLPSAGLAKDDLHSGKAI